MSVFRLEDGGSEFRQQLASNDAHLYCDAEQSSFEEVAGTCPNKDDPEMPCLTVRSMIIGLAFVIGMSILHMWIYTSAAAVLIPPELIVLIAHVIGQIWALLPWKIVSGGPWTIKEHTLVLIMGTVAWIFFRVYTFATLTYVQYREQQPSFKFVNMFFLIIAIQFLGFGLAGILRRFLVWPSGQVWPANFPLIALMRTLHENQASNKEGTYGENHKQNLWQKFISNRLRFFLIIMIIQFIYSWLSQYMMPVLGAFSWMCMIKPSNYLLAQLTGYYGLGMGSFSLDWFNLTWVLGSPLIIPLWALVNIAVGFVLATWIITPIIYFANVWETRSYPIAEVTNSSSDWSALGLVATAAAFANLSAVLVHMLLHHSKEWWKQLRTRSLDKKGNDVHCRLIALYPDVPDWWFAIVSLLALIVILVVGQVSGLLRWYSVLFAFTVPIVFVLPFGMVASITGLTTQNPSIYYLIAVIVSSLWADDKSHMLAFVAVSYTTYCETLQLLSNMKLGHYMKIAPRTLFWAHIVACLVCSSLSIAMQYYFFNEQGFTTNSTVPQAIGNFEVTNVGAAVVDQKSFFDSSTSRNRNLLWLLLIGAVLPVPFWLASQRWKWCRLVHIPLILTYISWMPLQPANTLFTWLLIGFFTMSFFRKLCWQRYVYLTSSALDAGFYFCGVVVHGPLAHYGVTFPSWWGFGGVNGDGCPLTLANATAFRITFQN